MKILLLTLITIATMMAADRTMQAAWDDPDNPAGTTYEVYKSDGPCSAVNFVKVTTTPLTVRSYTLTVAPGEYCFVVTARAPGAGESVFSNQASGSAPTFPPKNLSIVVTLAVDTRFMIDDGSGVPKAVAQIVAVK